MYLDYSSLWHFHAAGWNGVYNYETFTTTYIDGDTSVNGQYYYKQFRSVHTITNSVDNTYMLYGPNLLREDTNGDFLYYYNGSESTNLFNANIAAANVGDSFPAPGATCNVENIEYLSLGTQTLKHLYGAVNMPQAGIAEGIGYVGPTCSLGVEGNEVLVCYYRLGDSLCFASGYEYGDFPEPQYMSLGTSELPSSEFSIYPNPVNDQLTIEGSQDTFQWLCSDVTGKIIANGKVEQTTIVDVSQWNAGIYFLYLINADGNRTTQKLVVE